MIKKSIIYSLPSITLAVMGISFYVFIPKLYSKSLDIEQIGLIILLSRLFDAFTDPLIGYLSDKTKSNTGRRKPWIRFSVVPLCITFVFLFSELASEKYHFEYLMLFSFLFFLFWTAYTIPYEALGQELETDYDLRTVIFSFRDGAVVIGTLLAAAIPALAQELYQLSWLVISIVYAMSLLVFSSILLKKIDENNSIALPVKAKFNYKEILKNKYFKQLLIAYLVSSIGASLPATLFLFYVDTYFSGVNSSAVLALYFTIGIIALPFWIKLSFKIGKKETWLIALFVNAVSFFGVYFLKPGQINLYLLLISFSGLGYAACLVLPSSMQADIIDFEELKTGERKEGQFLGVWSFAKKTIAAISAGVALWILGRYGFDSNLAIQNKNAMNVLAFIYSFIPSICSLLSILIIRNYDLDKNKHLEIINLLNKK